MFGNKKKILSMDVPSPSPAGKPAGAAVDLLALVTGTAVIVMGATQLFVPIAAAPLTGLESGIGGDIIALQWMILGSVLMIGGIARLRVISIFAAEFLFIGSLAAAGVLLWREPGSFAIFVHGVIGILAFGSSGFARLTDKAELKRELRFARELAKPGQAGAPADSSLPGDLGD